MPDTHEAPRGEAGARPDGIEPSILDGDLSRYERRLRPTRRKRITFPPYGHIVHARRKVGDHPRHVNVLVGDGGMYQATRLAAIGRRDFAALPAGDGARFYDWRFVQGLDVSVHGYGGFDEDNVYRLCVALIEAGASLIACYPLNEHFRPEVGI